MSVGAPGLSEPLGQPIRGPRALTSDWRRFWSLTFTIARTEFKLKFFGSALGYLWQLMRPLMLFGVLYVVFTQVVKTGGSARYFPVVLLSGVVLYGFFTEATGGAVGSVLNRENLVRKIEFPRLVIPLSVVCTALFNLGINLVAVGVFLAIQGVHPHWQWVEIPLLLFVLAVFATGIAMLLSSLFVRFRDIQPIWDVISQALFYASPIIIPIERFAQRPGGILGIPWEHLAMLNPLAVVLEQWRHAVIDPHAPSAAQAIGGWPELMIPLGMIVGLFALGFWVFNRSAPLIAERL
jgi:ABC-2 type transport system permease protein